MFFFPFECCKQPIVVLSPTWIIRISTSCTSERKTKKTNIGFTNQRELQGVFVMERIFAGAMSYG
jgi:hypothetical protein